MTYITENCLNQINKRGIFFLLSRANQEWRRKNSFLSRRLGEIGPEKKASSSLTQAGSVSVCEFALRPLIRIHQDSLLAKETPDVFVSGYFLTAKKIRKFFLNNYWQIRPISRHWIRWRQWRTLVLFFFLLLLPSLFLGRDFLTFTKKYQFVRCKLWQCFLFSLCLPQTFVVVPPESHLNCVPSPTVTKTAFLCSVKVGTRERKLKRKEKRSKLFFSVLSNL